METAHCPCPAYPHRQTESLGGTWFDRTQEYTARLRGENFTRYEYSTRETVVLSSLPCWQRLTPDQYRERVASLVEEIEAEAVAERKHSGIQPLGAAAILKQNPHTWPNKTKKSASPGFHAATKAEEKRSGKLPAGGAPELSFPKTLLRAAVLNTRFRELHQRPRDPFESRF